MSGGPVDEFLAELSRHLSRDDATRARVVAELRDHLRDLVDEGRARGLDELAAELEAVDRFGSPKELARGLRTPRGHAGVAWAATALAGAALCGALAFSDLRPDSAGRGLPRAGQATVVGCVVALPPSTSPGARHVFMATRVALDPRYGTAVVRCPFLSGTVVYHITSAASPSVDPALTHDVSMATALHQ
jgi:hypothetical protein